MKSVHLAAVRLLPVLCCTCLSTVFFFFLTHNAVDIDVWHQMALGRETVNAGHVPLHDLFAYTPTVSTSIHHEWGAGLLAYTISLWFGAYGFLGLKYLLGLALALCLLSYMRQTGVRLSAFAAAVPAGLALLQPGLSTIRPQFYSLVFVALLLVFLESDRRGERKWIYFWLPAFAIWLNLHGGFTVGFGILGAEWLQRTLSGRRHAHLILVGLGMAALVPVNPYGLRYYSFILEAITMKRPYIEEWQPLWFWWDRWPFFVSCFVISVLVLAYAVVSGRRWNLPALFPLLLLLVASVLCMRMTYFYAVAWIFAVPGYLQLTSFGAFWESFWRRRPEALLVLFAAATFHVCRGRLAASAVGSRRPGRSDSPLRGARDLSGWRCRLPQAGWLQREPDGVLPPRGICLLEAPPSSQGVHGQQVRGGLPDVARRAKHRVVQAGLILARSSDSVPNGCNPGRASLPPCRKTRPRYSVAPRLPGSLLSPLRPKWGQSANGRSS